MDFYLVKLRLDSPLATPLHSGTLFGHLCWALRELEGEQELVRFLERLPQEPFLISDGFPAGWLPRPLLTPFRASPPGDPEARRRFFDTAKKRRKAVYMPVEDFLRLRTDLSARALEEVSSEPDGLVDFRRRESLPHNQIDRRCGHTLEEGGLFFLEEFWPRPDCLERDVYVRCALSRDRLAELFRHVGRCGYGRDATWGRGRFTVLSVDRPEPSLFAYRGNRMLSLSHGSLSPNMREPRYRVECHLGRLGNFWARTENPFKRPLLLLKPGATFAPADAGPFGELLEDVYSAESQLNAHIVHNAWHLAVGYQEVGES